MRRYHVGFPLLLTLAIAGVGACSSTANPSSTPGASPEAARSVVPSRPAGTAPAHSVALGPAVRLTLDTSGPMVASDAGPAGHHWVLPGAAARDRDGGFVLFIVWFGDQAGDQIVTVARSEDGRAWQVGKDQVLGDLGMDIVNPGAIPSAVLQQADGSWVLYGWAIEDAGPDRLTTWRASAPAPEGPWTLDVPKAVDVGAGGTWDSQAAAVGAVRPTADGFTLWYEGQGAGSSIRGDIGLATSTDGLAWTKAADPVIPRGACGTATSLAIQQPQVEAWSGGYVAAVAGAGPGNQDLQVFGLTSPDGRTWACASTDPILRAEDIPGSTGIHTIASVPLEGDRFGLIIESLVEGRSELWSATVEVGD